MNKDFTLDITIPSGSSPKIEFGRDFDVQGSITGNVSDDGILKVSLFDEDNNLVRYTIQNRKNNDNLYLDHPDFVGYEKSFDVDNRKLKEYGFPELMVEDLNNPYDSLNNATIKCFYNDNSFKSFIVSATDIKHGRVFETGMNYCDENNKPYSVLKQGKYTLCVELYDKENNLLAKSEKAITIFKREIQTIVRFNPVSHRRRVFEWAKSKGIDFNEDTLPGYLEPYLGKWFYHMGLLKYYRANDIALYENSVIHMFVYMIDPSSTSYVTELAYLQKNRVLEDSKRFHAYYYDIGEAKLGSRTGIIKQFDDNELVVYRVDVVNDEAKENLFNLDESGLNYSIYDLDNIKVEAGTRIGIAGAIKPIQLDPDDFILNDDNTYQINNSICKVVYEIDDENNTYIQERVMSMRRQYDGTIEDSVFEFYNIFELNKESKGKILTFKINAVDKNGMCRHNIKLIKVNVT